VTSATARLLLATRSAGKLRELLPLLAEAGFEAETLDDAGIPEQRDEDSLEAFDTFEANALAKARWFARLAPGRIVLADDSGLVVDALGGRPGVQSKRWSNRPDLAGVALDEANNALLVHALEAVPEGKRGARYICAAACVRGNLELVAVGETAGEILRGPRGAGGFGYDPYFLSADLGKGFAEVTREEKAAVSHRGRAFRALLAQLRASL
jgi:XTP/dITP diphosphohydrolase